MSVRTTYRRSDWYDGLRLRPGQDNIISQRDGEKHAVLRQKMAAGVSGDTKSSSFHADPVASIQERKMIIWNSQLTSKSLTLCA